MNDNQLDEMLELLKDSTPAEPSEKAKNLAISRAMEEFDKKNSPARQGTAPLNRLMDTVRTVYETIRGANFMKREYILAGGLSFAAIIAVLMTTSNLVPSPPMQTAHVTSELNAAKPAEKKSVWQKEESVIAQDKADMRVATLSPPPPPTQQKAESEVAPVPASAPAPMAKRAELSQMLSNTPSKEKTANYAAESVAGGAMGRAMVADSLMPQPEPYMPPSYHDEGRDKFQDIKANPVKLTKEEPVSTFSVDVDTSSYSFMRASINNNVLPQKDAVRIEEMINYFPYDYDAPKDKSEPFKANVSVFPTPWNEGTKLMHIGIKGYQLEQKEKPHSNLVFLIDTSGSMKQENKLPLLKNSLKLLLDNLQPDDTVAIVTYAGSAGVALPPTKASDKYKINSVLDGLGAGGSTAGAQGIKTAYELAESHFNKSGVNRVILATDGDFNVGITNQEELKSYIERKRDSGVFLSVLGFGRGNYNDALMQTLAQNGNGNAAYIDNLSEARKALVEEAGSTLFTIAKDVKIQVEFNPEQVAEYRLIGYETRILNREDFNNDKVDAGDIGSGHTVTAIYEITPVGSKSKLIDDSRYQKPAAQTEKKDSSGEYAFVKIRYKLPESSTSKLITTAVDSKVEYKNISEVPTDARFAASVAGFGQLLRGDPYTRSYSYDDVINLAQAAKGDDKFGYRAEFINMARLAKTMSQGLPVRPQTSIDKNDRN
jgi:Ca-activated chloride channel family protein